MIPYYLDKDVFAGDERMFFDISFIILNKKNTSCANLLDKLIILFVTLCLYLSMEWAAVHVMFLDQWTICQFVHSWTSNAIWKTLHLPILRLCFTGNRGLNCILFFWHSLSLSSSCPSNLCVCLLIHFYVVIILFFSIFQIIFYFSNQNMTFLLLSF